MKRNMSQSSVSVYIDVTKPGRNKKKEGLDTKTITPIVIFRLNNMHLIPIKYFVCKRIKLLEFTN